MCWRRELLTPGLESKQSYMGFMTMYVTMIAVTHTMAVQATSGFFNICFYQGKFEFGRGSTPTFGSTSLFWPRSRRLNMLDVSAVGAIVGLNRLLGLWLRLDWLLVRVVDHGC